MTLIIGVEKFTLPLVSTPRNTFLNVPSLKGTTALISAHLIKKSVKKQQKKRNETKKEKKETQRGKKARKGKEKGKTLLGPQQK